MKTQHLPKIILASGSPRRKELLSTLEIPFEIITSGVSEEVDPNLDPVEMVKVLAKMKATAVAKKIQEGLVIGSDTTIAFEDRTLGKPTSQENAKQMLEMLRNKKHQVISGIAILDSSSMRIEVGTVTTSIRMRNYSDQELIGYIATGEPMDKAGSYAIQGKGSSLIAEIEGCYNNVVGFPLCELVKLLEKFGVSVNLRGSVCNLPSGDACPRLQNN